MGRGLGMSAVGVWLLLVLGACGEDPTPEGAEYPAPDDSFCGDLTDSALSAERWLVNGSVDDEDYSATCTMTSSRQAIEVMVLLGGQAQTHFDQASSSLADGASGFVNAEVSEPDGWWSEGQRYIADGDSVRVADVVLGDGVFARVQVTEVAPPERGAVDQRRDSVVSLADQVVAAVPEALAG